MHSPRPDLFSQAIAAHRGGDRAAAIRLCRQAAAIATDPSPSRLLSVLLAEEGRIEEARHWAADALRKAPDNAASLAAMGRVELRAGAPDAASRWFKAAYAADPSLVAAREGLAHAEHALGRAAFHEGRFGDAATRFAVATSLRVSEPGWWHDLGTSLHEAGRLDEAEETYRRALSLEPGHVPSWHNLASVRQTRRDMEGAMRAYGEAYRIDPATLPRIAQELAAGNPGRVYLRVETLIDDLRAAVR